MDQTTIIKLVQKELEELGLLLKGFDGMAEIPQPIKTLTISKAEHLLDILRKLEYSRKEKDGVAVEPLNVKTESKPLPTQTVKNEVIPEVVVVPLPKKEEAPVPEPESATKDVVEEIESPELGVTKMPESTTEPEPVSEPEAADELDEEAPVTVKAEAAAEKKKNPSKQILGESIKAGVKVGDVIGAEGRSSIGSKLEASAINDLKKAISLADRFRYQKDLFGNNADLMNNTIDKLNGMKTMDEAMACVVDEFDWDDELESKRDFISLIGRRFQ